MIEEYTLNITQCKTALVNLYLYRDKWMAGDDLEQSWMAAIVAIYRRIERIADSDLLHENCRISEINVELLEALEYCHRVIITDDGSIDESDFANSAIQAEETIAKAKAVRP